MLMVQIQFTQLKFTETNQNIYNVAFLKDTLNKGHNTFNLSIQDEFCGPYRTMAIQFYLLKRTTTV